MKKLMFIAMIISCFSFAHAEDPADVNLTKASLDADFNKMIDGNDHTRRDIQKNIDQRMANEDTDEVSEKSRVLDLIDVEVGWGETPNPIVDRRFDSVGAAVPVDINALVPNFVN